MIGDINGLSVYKLATELEAMTYLSQKYIPKDLRYNLWNDVIKNASNVCDGLCDAYHAPKNNLILKYESLSFAFSNLRQIERRTATANNIQALSDDHKAKYDIKLHEVRNNLSGWINSIGSKLNQSITDTSVVENS